MLASHYEYGYGPTFSVFANLRFNILKLCCSWLPSLLGKLYTHTHTHTLLNCTLCLFALPENLLIELPVTMEFKNIPTITCFLFVISIVAFYFPIPEFFPNGASVCPLSVTPKVCGQFPRYLGT